MRIFLASTATDLAAHREKVCDAILRLEHLPVAMETSPAADGTPADECRARAAGADALVVLLAHRYGYVPTPELGGDGRRSITWLEVEAARQAGRPVFAFLLHPDAPWDQPRESAALDDAPERAHDIAERVMALREFRDHLAATCTCGTFTTPDELATRVVSTLATHLGSGTRHAPARAWRPLAIHPLQPATHFHGRQALVAELLAWVQDAPAAPGVVSLVAAGGTGKTALAEQVVTRASAPAGVLVWSFYHDDRTEEFLRVACEYFIGGEPVPVGGRLERLQLALSGDVPHLLVLDGLERVQMDGRDGRVRGTLGDPQLKRLLQYLASAGCRARALVTSRFPVADLAAWEGRGSRDVRLEDIEPAAARALLREWNVRGGDDALDALASQVDHHALTLAVLGSYLGNYCGGDPQAAPRFHRAEAAGTDVQAMRLGRVLEEYARVLDPAERALLGRLAAFTRGVDVTVLSYLADADGPVSGALEGLDEPRIRQLLGRLNDLGLVYAYEVDGTATFTAHLFVRDYFDQLRDVPARDVHEVVRQRLAPRLAARPGQYPVDASILREYEQLIETTRLAGRVREAWNLYWDGLGGYSHLGKWLGENALGLRVVAGFSADGTVGSAEPSLPHAERALLLDNWGLYAKNLGDLTTSRQAFEAALEIWTRRDDGANCSAILQNLADTEILGARLGAAHDTAAQALAHAEAAGDTAQLSQAHAFAATVCALTGDVDRAAAHFQEASQAQARHIDLLRRFRTPGAGQNLPTFRRDDLLYSAPGLLEAEFHLMCGRTEQATFQLQVTRGRAQHERSERTRAVCDTLLGRLALADSVRTAGDYLAAARAFNDHAGVVEIKLRCHLLAAELRHREGNLDEARREALAGLLLADPNGFGRHSIELRVALARIELDAGDPRQALARAREALERATVPGCRYAWAESDALDLAGRAHLLLGRRDAGRRMLSAAVEIRSRLGHPALDETRAALAQASSS